MRLRKFIFILLTLLLLFTFETSCLAVSPYIWSGSSASGLLETVSDTETNLKLESGGAILIEQSTRFCFIRTQFT